MPDNGEKFFSLMANVIEGRVDSQAVFLLIEVKAITESLSNPAVVLHLFIVMNFA